MLLESNDSPYCPKCESCGEEACCSALRCAYEHMVKNKDKDCLYSEQYFIDIQFYYNLGKDLFNACDEILTKEQCETIYNNLYEKIYNNNEE